MTRPSNTGSLPSRCAGDSVSSLNCCCTSAVARTWLAVVGACRQTHGAVGSSAEARPGRSGGEERRGAIAAHCAREQGGARGSSRPTGRIPDSGCSATVDAIEAQRLSLTRELELPAASAVESLLLRFPVNFLSVSIGRSSLPLRGPHRQGRC